MFEITLRTSRVQHLAVEIILEELNAFSISLMDAEDKPVFVEQLETTPIWEQVTFCALFEKDIDAHTLQKNIEAVLESPIEITKKIINDQDWQNVYKQNFEATQFGERLWVCPSWQLSPDPFAINITLDPGLAFGTGTHPTTALCLKWLAQHSIQGKDVIDFGCGSGILAIAAYYLGAAKVFAIDHDPQAIQATLANANCNRVPSEKLKTYVADQLSPVSSEQTCDILLANVLLQPLLKLEQQFAQRLNASGKIILSGILETQLEELSLKYQQDFNIDNVYSNNEWLLVEATLL